MPDNSSKKAPHTDKGTHLSAFVTMATKTAGIALLATGLAGCINDNHHDAVILYKSFVKQYEIKDHLRRDIDPADVTYTNEDLADHFQRIALRTEINIFSVNGDTSKEKVLTRWDVPIRYNMYHSFEKDNTSKDRFAVKAFMGRLSRLTGLKISEDRKITEDTNYIIKFFSREDRDNVLTVLRNMAKENSKLKPLVQQYQNWVFELGIPCFVSPYQKNNLIEHAYVYVKQELPKIIIEACIHEELSQSLGLFNDDDGVRPSIFNDDQEFVRMTRHDEYLLKILYDERLQPGMSADEAMPIVRDIISELRPET